MDAHLRDLERRKNATGDPADEGRWLQARTSAGELAACDLEAAALLGYAGARAATGIGTAPPRAGLDELFSQLLAPAPTDPKQARAAELRDRSARNDERRSREGFLKKLAPSDAAVFGNARCIYSRALPLLVRTILPVTEGGYGLPEVTPPHYDFAEDVDLDATLDRARRLSEVPADAIVIPFAGNPGYAMPLVTAIAAVERLLVGPVDDLLIVASDLSVGLNISTYELGGDARSTNREVAVWGVNPTG